MSARPYRLCDVDSCISSSFFLFIRAQRALEAQKRELWPRRALFDDIFTFAQKKSELDAGGPPEDV